MLYKSFKKSFYFTVQKVTFSFKDFFNKCEQTRSFIQTWSHLLTTSVNEKFNFCAVPKTKIAKQNTVIEIETLMFVRKFLSVKVRIILKPAS